MQDVLNNKRKTEQFVTVGLVTLRFYCNCQNNVLKIVTRYFYLVVGIV